MKKNNKNLMVVLCFLILLQVDLSGDFLYTVDGKVFEGQMVAFKYNVIFLNVYRFGKFHRLMRFPLSQVWKIEFNQREKEGLL